MKKWITKKQILDLIRDKKFSTEEEMENHIVSKLPDLFGIKEEQIERQFNTTNFDGKFSNRSDIIIRSDDEIKVLLVIELKLSKSIENYNKGDLDGSIKQLYKYAQDVRAPFGLLLTDISCHVFENKFFFKGKNYKRIDGDNLPSIKEMEKKITFNCFAEFLICKYSINYFFSIIFLYLFLVELFKFSSKVFGSLLSFFIVILASYLIASIMHLVWRYLKYLD